jgi:hypothetical protein
MHYLEFGPPISSQRVILTGVPEVMGRVMDVGQDGMAGVKAGNEHHGVCHFWVV